MGGCQTSGFRPGVDTELGQTAMQVIAASCRVVKTNNTSAGGYAPSPFDTLINTVTVQSDGWLLIDFSYFSNQRRLNGKAIYDPKTLKGTCSDKREHAILLPRFVSHAAIIENSSDYPDATLRNSVTPYLRSIQVYWSGHKQPFSGEYVFKETDIAPGAWLSVNTPYDTEPCTGSFYSPNPYYVPEALFRWNLTCRNGATLSGTFDAPLAENGHIGKGHADGSDSLGQPVTFSF